MHGILPFVNLECYTVIVTNPAWQWFAIRIGLVRRQMLVALPSEPEAFHHKVVKHCI